MTTVRMIRLAAVFALFAIVGCSNPPPEKKLLGKWTGTPNVREDVDKLVDSAAQGAKLNPLAKGILDYFGQKVAAATISVKFDFQQGGHVFFRGRTDLIGLPPDSDGTWSVSEAGKNEMNITFGTDKKKFTGKVLFRDKKEFTLKLDEHVSTLAPPPPPPPKNDSRDQDMDATKEHALAEDIKTVGGNLYKDATIIRVEGDGIVVRTKTGISKVYFVELPASFLGQKLAEAPTNDSNDQRIDVAKEQALVEDLKTARGNLYKDDTIIRVEPDGIVVRTTTGISKLYFVELPNDIRERFQPTAAKEAAQEQPKIASIVFTRSTD